MILFILLFIFILYFVIIINRINSKSFYDYQFKKNSSQIPSIIYTFWNGTKLPPFIKKCINSWKRYNPSYTIIILNKKNLSAYLSEDIFSFKHSDSPQRISDFIRLSILKKTGGIWMDASIYLNKSLDWIHHKQYETQSEFIGYSIQSCGFEKRNHNIPIIESWFLASVPNSRFISDWHHSFFSINEFNTVDDYVTHIRNKTDIHGISNPSYLTIHIACLHIIESTKIPYNLYLLPSEEAPYLYLDSISWNPLYYIPMLLYFHGTESPIIKYRGSERLLIETLGLYHLYQ